MGYRLDVTQVGGTLSYYGTKLFGYEEANKLESAKWFVKYMKAQWEIDIDLEVDDPWCYNASLDTVMYIKDFKYFIKLYNKDYNKYCPYPHEEDCVIKEKGLQEILKLNDYDRVVVSWG